MRHCPLCFMTFPLYIKEHLFRLLSMHSPCSDVSLPHVTGTLELAFTENLPHLLAGAKERPVDRRQWDSHLFWEWESSQVHRVPVNWANWQVNHNFRRLLFSKPPSADSVHTPLVCISPWQCLSFNGMVYGSSTAATRGLGGDLRILYLFWIMV